MRMEQRVEVAVKALEELAHLSDVSVTNGRVDHLHGANANSATGVAAYDSHPWIPRPREQAYQAACAVTDGAAGALQFAREQMIPSQEDLSSNRCWQGQGFLIWDCRNVGEDGPLPVSAILGKLPLERQESDGKACPAGWEGF